MAQDAGQWQVYPLYGGPLDGIYSVATTAQPPPRSISFDYRDGRRPRVRPSQVTYGFGMDDRGVQGYFFCGDGKQRG